MFLLFIGFILLPFAFLDKIIAQNFKKAFVFIVCAFFIFLGGVRWNTGTDWNAYLYGFNALKKYSNISEYKFFEWGFSYLNYLIKSLTNSYTIFLLIFTFLKVYFKFKILINKEFINYSLFSLFMYYCYSNGDILSTRQALAVSITFFSTLFLISNNRLKFFSTVFIAFLFHKSAIFFGFAYFIYYKEFSKKILISSFLSSMIIGLILLQMNVSDFLINIPIISKISMFQDKIEAYSNSGQVTYGAIDSTTTIILGYLKKVFVILPILLNLNLFKKNKVMLGLVNILVFGSIIYFILGAVSSEFKRINGFFEIYEILLVPYLIYNIKYIKLRFLLIVLYLVYSFTRMYSGFSMFWDLIDPFYTIFDSYNFRNLY
ncbi:EpsG family protein [Empedobacter sp.]|uniref:EpsG family protein n=1 Tax=Empedobacter sp. TaxID=1927715 RepID=UPI0028A0CE2A|nr:EpsG family protein [Empedobacter sp.]